MRHQQFLLPFNQSKIIKNRMKLNIININLSDSYQNKFLIAYLSIKWVTYKIFINYLD